VSDHIALIRKKSDRLVGTRAYPIYSLHQTQAILPIRDWQAARPVSVAATASKGYSLVACMIGPGFDFTDFSLLQEGSAEAGHLLKISL
jgi:predicted cupin superfamily sugar epimerase